MFYINSKSTNYVLYLLIGLIIIYLYINSSNIFYNHFNLSTKIDHDYIKNIILKQDKIILDLEHKINSHDIINQISNILNKANNNKLQQNKSIEKKIEKSIEKSIEKKLEKSIEKSIEKSLEKSIEKSIEKKLEKKLEKSISPKRVTDPMYIRDNQVLNDKLYPPLGRTERPTADLLMKYMNNQSNIYNIQTRGPPDTFRPIGYLTRKDGNQTIDSTLILFGRAKYSNSDIGEFYATSSNKNSDIKIPLGQTNCNIKKITDVPIDVSISGNLLSGDYNFTELPKPDIQYPYI